MALIVEKDDKVKSGKAPSLASLGRDEEDEVVEERPNRSDRSVVDRFANLESQVVQEQILNPESPFIEGAFVIYLGASRTKRVIWKGSVTLERIEIGDGQEDEVMRGLSDEGNTVYDFNTHDSRKRMIRTRMVPDTAAARYRGKMWLPCEHPEHLRRFFRVRNAAREREFEVMVPDHMKPIWNEYVRRTEHGLGMRKKMFDETLS